MGFDDREYARGGAGGGFFEGGGYGGGIPPVLKWLLIVNAVVFVLQLVVTRPFGFADLRDALDPQAAEQLEQLPEAEREELARRYARAHGRERVSIVQEWLALDPDQALFRGQIWRFVTYAFCHDRTGPWHILVNLWILWIFGPSMERMYGSREFLWFYLTAAVVAALVYLGLASLFGDRGALIGASGAVVATLMLFAVHYPRHTIYLFFVIPVEVRWLVLLYVVFELHPVLLQLGGERPMGNVAHSAHLGGLAFGYLYWRYRLRLDETLGRFRLPRLRRRPRARRQIRLYEPPRREDLDRQVDALLQKIHEHGEASLTDEERALLREASRRYKSR